VLESLRSRSPEQLAAPLAPGPIMGGQPISDLVWAMVEHTAHHRGALTDVLADARKSSANALGRYAAGIRHLGGIVEGARFRRSCRGSMVIGSGLGGALGTCPGGSRMAAAGLAIVFALGVEDGDA